ncbi:sulfur-oxidizing protein SoxA [Duganella sp. 1224]|uniref:sulfur oxidation c-type cytochrome SoxA n=1 Tax=Duganella sp. 1224 TaxID=2587052 RepID=UPI0015C7AC5A|nr:sulfur oxidation c-type cytochrome SoxA [Duganella sp. 1224]NYE64084.1 sulfur-oxidizing protein SoxA [Duganella sp. 1224]
MKWLLALAMVAASALAADERRSGADFMSAATQAMQGDDAQNPGMLWVASGETEWNKSCVKCHGDARGSMRGVAARFPALDADSGKVVNLNQRINLCRERKLHAAPLAAESETLLALEAYVAIQSRGMPVTPAQDSATRAAAARGQRLYQQRIGQLNLSCAQCHDQQWGKKLAGSTIPQAHASAYPIYRLEWQGMGSLQRRLRNCMSGVRAEVPPFGAKELTELEAWLAVRDAGMTVESPGVRP